MTPAEHIRSLKGLVATVTVTGSVKPQYAASFANLRSYNDRHDIHNVEYQIFPGILVESGRDAAVIHALKEKYDWILQIDADAAPFPADAVERMLMTIFVRFPNIDALGAYANLKGPNALPSIDTGSGTWEEHYPGEGVIPVIRTGAHFLMAKTSLFRRLGPPPWFRTRMSSNPLRAMKDLDNFARMKLNGENPLKEHPEWPTIFAEAKRVSGSMTPAGEDSSFCDLVKAFGMHLAVDTDLVTGHVDDKIITFADFAKAVKERDEVKRMCLGVLP